jgi:phosphoglycolate phosphatase
MTQADEKRGVNPLFLRVATYIQGAVATILCKDVRLDQIEAIVFDKDGTLADSAAFLRNLGQRRSRLLDAKIPGVQDPLLMAFGLDNNRLNPAGLLAVGTRQENEVAAAAYVAETGRDWMEALSIVQSAFQEADRYMQRKAEQTPIFAGVLELLQHLATTHLKVGILSSDTTANVIDFVHYYQLKPYIHLEMGTDGGICKPNPLLLQQACAALGVMPGRSLLIGDSQADIQLGRSAGAAGCVGVTWGLTDALCLTGADVIVDQPEQIQVLIQSSVGFSSASISLASETL